MGRFFRPACFLFLIGTLPLAAAEKPARGFGVATTARVASQPLLSRHVGEEGLARSEASPPLLNRVSAHDRKGQARIQAKAVEASRDLPPQGVFPPKDAKRTAALNPKGARASTTDEPAALARIVLGKQAGLSRVQPAETPRGLNPPKRLIGTECAGLSRTRPEDNLKPPSRVDPRRLPTGDSTP